MVSMKDVAKECGVSQATVSYAYNGSPKISKEMRALIFSTAEKIGYMGPDVRAKSLKSGRVGAIGVMVMDQLSYACTDPWIISLLQGISSVEALADVALTLIPINNSRFKNGVEIEKYSVATRGLVDGLIISTLPDDHPVVRAIIRQKIPAVILDAPLIEDVHFIGIDDRSAAIQQMEHILSLGHKKIGIIIERLIPDGYKGYINLARLEKSTERISRERLKGYLHAAEKAGISFSQLSIYEAGGFSIQDGMNATNKLIQDHKVTAIVAASDVMAIGSLNFANKENINVPKELSVIGFDDIPEASIRDLTTIHQPLLEKGAYAAQLLLESLNEKQSQKPQMKIFETQLLRRKSTACPQ
ncbi:LacI family transcriptional regulator [Acinetobacter sp. ANC 4558]|uniref:LacI family DNA-binding transcriptional regulator n=1 Tax=Acinetobacter sp. ANC 4558 TaxID=1977876 RepID=UPI000A34924B|nr:substrate-binding domain-containing protein [Acinetobacter sp. ANC 4558]OTG79198.1 LacI family transcriptional regulator [Acinetobacter sp. ANC 4558]